MVRSRISRSIIVVVFVISILVLGFLDIKCIIQEKNSSVISNVIKIAFALSLALLVGIYVYIKDKLYRIKMKRSNALVIRYIYMSFIVILTALISIYKNIKFLNVYYIGMYLFLTIITSFVIKKVIFNVSKSDILSVIGTFSYSMLPVLINDINLFMISMFLVLFLFLSILLLQMVIDELKQKGIKTKKYIYLSCLLGLMMGVTTIFGINPLIWCISSVILLFITVNLDNTHLSFPKLFIRNVNQSNREKLYAVERVNISKLLLCIIISLCLMMVINKSGLYLLSNINHGNNGILNIIINISNSSGINKANIVVNLINLLSNSKRYYLVLITYIILIEILHIFLKRRYDTKSTIIKAIFVLVISSICLFNINVVAFQPLFSELLVLIAIINTSNIYLNREERIKMLVA